MEFIIDQSACRPQIIQLQTGLNQARPLHVQPWSVNFDVTSNRITSIVAWVRLPGLPVHCYDKKTLITIGGIIGKVMKLDSQTAGHSRGRFARIAVELDLTQPLCAEFTIQGKLQRVEYENLPLICFNCGLYGHDHSKCPSKDTGADGHEMAKKGDGEGIGSEALEKSAEEGRGYRPWMVAQKPKRPQNRKLGGLVVKASSNNGKENALGSRFEILSEVEETQIGFGAEHNGIIRGFEGNGSGKIGDSQHKENINPNNMRRIIGKKGGLSRKGKEIVGSSRPLEPRTNGNIRPLIGPVPEFRNSSPLIFSAGNGLNPETHRVAVFKENSHGSQHGMNNHTLARVSVDNEAAREPQDDNGPRAGKPPDRNDGDQNQLHDISMESEGNGVSLEDMV